MIGSGGMFADLGGNDPGDIRQGARLALPRRTSQGPGCCPTVVGLDVSKYGSGFQIPESWRSERPVRRRSGVVPRSRARAFDHVVAPGDAGAM